MVHTVILGGAMILYKCTIYKEFATGYLTSSGAPPLANGREAPQAPQSIRGYPELLKTIYAIKQLVISLQVTQHLKTLELGKSPSRPPEQNHVQSVSRQGRPELYQTDTTQVVLSIQENYITKYYKLALQNSFHEQKLPRG